MRLALSVVAQTLATAAAERIVQDEIETKQIRQFVTVHFAFYDAAEMSLNALRRHLI